MAQSGMMQQALRGLLDPESRFKADEKTGKKILATAWVVEILAASLGLFIAWTMAFRALYNIENPNFNDYTSAILGALPFVLIAIIEPMKIPLASGLYRVKHLGWKSLILAGLFLLTFVTFETMFTGLETQNYNVTRVITDTNAKIQRVQTDKAKDEKELDAIKSETKEKLIENTEKGIAALRESSRQKLDLINGEIAARTTERKSERLEKQKEINRLSALNSATSPSKVEQAIKEEILALEKTRDKIIERKEAAINSYKSVILNKNKSEETRKENFNKEKDEKILKLNSSIKEINQEKENLRVQLEETKSIINKTLQEILSGINDAYSAELSSCNFSCSTIAAKKKKDRDEAQLKATNEINTRAEEYESSKQRLETQIDDIKNKITAINEEAYQQNPIERIDEQKISEIEKSYSPKINSIDEQIRKANANLIDVSRTRSGEASTRIAAIQKDIELIDKAIAEIQVEYDPRIAELNKQTNLDISKIQLARDKELDNITERRKKINVIQRKIEEYGQQLSALEDIKRQASRESNIYRITASVYGVEDIIEVTPDQLKWVSGIWFGSIAFVAATVGTILALIAFILQDPKAFEERERWYRARTLMKYLRLGFMRVFILLRAAAVLLTAITSLLLAISGTMRGFFGRPLQRSIRGLSASIRRRLNDPKVKIEQVEKEVVVVKEVIKEVPVDKIVVKEIVKEVPVDRIVTKEVPVEVVRETVVHVPIASDDLSILNIQGRDKDGR